jgi:uncharacterized membrane-anchored protein
MDATQVRPSKVPEVTLGFWIIKIIATTLGETGGDAVSMTMQLGYAVSSIIFIAIFLVAASAQITAKAFHPFLYWAVIVATTTAGTTMADFADRSLGIGYAGGASILFALLMTSLLVWYLTLGSVSVFGAGLALVAAAYFYTNISRALLFWAAFILTRPLGATLGDLLDKPLADGGLEIGRFYATAVLAALMIACILLFKQNAGRHPGATEQNP